MSDAPREEAPREGSVAGYDRDEIHLDPEEWVDDVAEAPEALFSPMDLWPGLAAVFRSGGIAEAAKSDTDVAATAESRHLTVDAPTEVQPRERFPVHVQLTIAPRGPFSEPTRTFAIPEQGRSITIDVSASDNLASASSTTAQTIVQRGADSDPLRFELVATREGRGSVDVKAFADAQFIGAVHVEVTVQNDAQGSRQRVAVPSTIAAGDARALTLEIRLDDARENYEFQIRGNGFTERPVRAPFADLDVAARGLQQQLNELARGARYSELAVHTILSNQGADLFARLPLAVQTRLTQSVGSADRLSIVLTDNDPVPWELVYLTKGANPGFLSDRFLVTRWPYGAGPPLELGLGSRCYVLPPDPPTAASNEIDTVESRVGSGRRLHTVNDVLHELAARGFGLMHFAAHNVPQFNRPAASSIQLDQAFTQAMVGRTLEGALAERRPLVFLNACSSNTPTPTLADTGAEGWATRFLLIGAGGFIGTLWEIRDASAARFADAFYAGIVNGSSVGAAFRDARAAIRSGGDPTWLAYTLYAHPSALYRGAGA